MSFDHADGWVGWMYCAPVIGDAPVQIMRDGWDEPSLICRDDMRPDMNVAGLYWRRTGIYREREGMLPEGENQPDWGSSEVDWGSVDFQKSGRDANCMAAPYACNWIQAILGGGAASGELRS